MSTTQQPEPLRHIDEPQPNALCLAHTLSGGKLIDDSTEWADTLHAAAAELRRQHARIKELESQLAATQPAAHGMVQDAVRYQALVKSGNFAPSPFDNGMWGLRVSRVPSTKAELDAAVDRVIAAQAHPRA